MPSPSAFALSLPARAESATVVRHVLGGVTAVWPVSSELLDDVQIAVAEACANVVMHAYPQGRPGVLEVRGDVEEGQVVVVVADHGSGVAPRPDSPGLGLGLALIGALTERLELGPGEDGRHEVRMVFPREPA